MFLKHRVWKCPNIRFFPLTKPVKPSIILHMMREVSPRIAWYVLISVSIVVLLGACLKPIDVKFPQKDDQSKGEVKVDVDFEPIEDILPVLQASIGGIISPVTADETVSVSLDSLGGDAITVINMEAYDAVEWHYNRGPVEDGATFVLGSMTAIFNTAGVYPVTAVGRKAGVSYSTLFYISVGFNVGS